MSDQDAVLLVCSGLAVPRNGGLEPLGPKGWSALSDHIEEAGLTPGELVSMSVDELEAQLSISTEQATRVERLLARHGQLAFELERIGRLGMWVATIGGDGYPERLTALLGSSAPPVLFGLGERALLEMPGLGVVGSRDADAAALDVAREAGAAAAGQAWATVSGAARGVDVASMRGALGAGGVAIGVTADGLERHLRDASLRAPFAEGRAVYVSPYRPHASFSAGAAMGRNKLIYCLSRLTLVVHATSGSGGTWSGATEALKAGWVRIFVARARGIPGNAELIRRGGWPLPDGGLADLGLLADVDSVPTQQTLFEPPASR